MNVMLTVIFNALHYHRNRTFLVIVIVVVISCYGITKLWITIGVSAFFSDSDATAQAFETLARHYGDSSTVGLIIAPESGDVFDRETLQAISQFTEEAHQIPYGQRIYSLTNYKFIYDQNDELQIESLLSDSDNLEDAALVQVRDRYLVDTLVIDKLFSSNGHVTLAYVQLSMPQNNPLAIDEVYHAITEMKDRYSQRYPSIRFLRIGNVIIERAVAESTARDLRLSIPLSAMLMTVLAFLLLRSAYAVGLTLLVVFLSSLIAFGLKGYFNGEISPLTAMAPMVIMTLAVADCVHLLVSYLKLLGDGWNRQTALEESLRLNSKAISLTSLTSVIGFLCFNFSPSPVVRDMGNVIALGVLAAWLLALFFLPAVVMSLPEKTRKASPLLTSAMPKLAVWVINNHRFILLSSLLLVPLMLIGLPKNSINEVLIEMFDESFAVRSNANFFNAELNGIQRIYFDLPARGQGGINDVDYLTTLDQFAAWLKTQTIVRGVDGYHDLIKRMNRILHQDNPAYYRIPDDRDLSAQYLLLYEMSADSSHLVDHKHSRTRMVVYIDLTSSNALLQLNDDASTWLKQNAPDYMQTSGVSRDILFAVTAKKNSESMYFGTLFALCLISFVITFSIGNVKLGGISLLTNLVPVLVAYSIWGLIHARIGLSVAMVAAFCMGLVVDDTIHFITKFQDGLKARKGNVEAALHLAFAHSGNGILVTSILFVCGISMMLMSHYVPNTHMGILVAITISLAVVFDLLVLPALLYRFYRPARSDVVLSDKLDQAELGRPKEQRHINQTGHMSQTSKVVANGMNNDD